MTTRTTLCLTSALLLAAQACGSSPTGPIDRGPVASVELSARSLDLARGETRTLVALPRAADGRPLKGRPVAWRSDDPAIAAVDQTGRVTAMGVGTARITATVEGRSAEVPVGVLPAHAGDLAGRWRMRAFDGLQVPAAYAVLYDQPVGDRIVGVVEIRLDSAGMALQGDATYQRRYCFTEVHDSAPWLRYCWGDHGRVSLGAGAERGRVALESEYIQHLRADGEARADHTLALREPLWHGEDPRATVWERR